MEEFETAAVRELIYSINHMLSRTYFHHIGIILNSDPNMECVALHAAGLTVVDTNTASPRTGHSLTIFYSPANCSLLSSSGLRKPLQLMLSHLFSKRCPMNISPSSWTVKSVAFTFPQLNLSDTLVQPDLDYCLHF